jgi:hypothetical protein
MSQPFPAVHNAAILAARSVLEYGGAGAPPIVVPPAPTVTITMTPATVEAGVALVFVATGVSTVALTYQWKMDGLAIVGATAATYNRVTQLADNGKVITCTVTDTFAQEATSTGETMLVTAPLPAPPTITINVAPLTVIAGGQLSFLSSTFGVGPFTYQWRLSGVDIAGATIATYDRITVLGDNGLGVTCFVTDGSLQTVLSNEVIMSVT